MKIKYIFTSYELEILSKYLGVLLPFNIENKSNNNSLISLCNKGFIRYSKGSLEIDKTIAFILKLLSKAKIVEETEEKKIYDADKVLIEVGIFTNKYLIKLYPNRNKRGELDGENIFRY